jgi:photosystem II stability/assembly factor-like uncharacterized protein
MSSNGQRQVTAQTAGNIYTATNYAATFSKITQIGVAGTFQGIAQSTSGQYVVAYCASGFFVSSDYGITWGSSISGVNSGNYIAPVGMSGNGRVIIACDTAGSNLFISTNYGASFSKTASPATTPTSIAINSTGSVVLLACGVFGAVVYKTSL